MNILFLDSIEKTTYGGMEEWIRLVSAGLKGRGHNVTVIGREGSSFLERVESTQSGVRTLGLNLSGDFRPTAINSLKKEIASQEVDIVCTNFNRDIRLGGIAARFAGKAKVVWSAGLDITRDSMIHRVLTPRLIDKVLVPSASLGRQVTHLGYIEPDIVEVIPIGIGPIDPPIDRIRAAADIREKFSLPDDAIVSVTTGRFVEQKGHKYLVDAAAKIVKEYPTVHFVLLGDGPLEDDLRKQIEKNGLAERFHFCGMVNDIRPILAGADLMIHPSIVEPFGIAILEGMRASLPVVASRVGGIPEVVVEGETAVLIEPRHAGLLTSAVGELLDYPQAMTAMGEAGRLRWKELFQLEQMITKVEASFAALMTEERAHGKA